MRSRFETACVCAMLGVVLPLTWGATDVFAQDEPTLGSNDYDQWERLGGGVLSPDGTWMAVPIGRVNDEGELRIHRTESDSVVVVAFGTRATFTNHCNDNRDVSCSCMINCFYRLRHYAVICRHYKDGDICYLSTSCSHRCKRFVPGSVQESYWHVTVLNLISSNVLSDSSRFSVHHICFSYPVQ